MLSKSHAQKLYSHYFVSQFLMLILKIGFHQYNTSGSLFSQILIILTLKLLKLTSRNNEGTYLRFDFPNSTLGPESNSRLRSKMAKFSDMMPGERELRKRIFNEDYYELSQLINCVW